MDGAGGLGAVGVSLGWAPLAAIIGFLLTFFWSCGGPDSTRVRRGGTMTDPQYRTAAHVLQGLAALISIVFSVAYLSGRTSPLPPFTLFVAFACLIGAWILFAKTGKL